MMMLEARTIVLASCALVSVWGCAQQETPDPALDTSVMVAQASALLADSPLAVIRVLDSLPDGDAKLALTYLAEVGIAARTDEMYFYSGEPNPRGWYDQAPDRYGEYVLQNLDHFTSASEATGIGVSTVIVDRVTDRSHGVVGTAALRPIQRSDASAWEDGDGTSQVPNLLREYREWLAGWPDHDSVSVVRGRVARLEALAP